MPEALPDSHESRLLEQAMQHSPVAYAYFDAGDRLRHWNPAYEDLNFRIREHIRPGAYFPDLLTELVICGQIQIAGQTTAEWIDERLRARREGGLAFRHLSNGRVYLVQERKDEIGGTLGFWVNVSELMHLCTPAGLTGDVTAPPRELSDHGVQDRLRSELQIMQGNLELLGQEAGDIRTAALADEALQAGRVIAEILDTRRKSAA